jgi:hypothetical protein
MKQIYVPRARKTRNPMGLPREFQTCWPWYIRTCNDVTEEHYYRTNKINRTAIPPFPFLSLVPGPFSFQLAVFNYNPNTRVCAPPFWYFFVPLSLWLLFEFAPGMANGNSYWNPFRLSRALFVRWKHEPKQLAPPKRYSGRAQERFLILITLPGVPSVEWRWPTERTVVKIETALVYKSRQWDRRPSLSLDRHAN